VRAHPAVGPSMVGLGVALMLYGAACAGEAGQGPRTWLGRTGSLSYEIYLLHAAIQLLLMEIMPRPSGLGSYVVFVAVMAVTYFISAGTARIFSQPANRWIRSRFSNHAHGRVASDGGLPRGAALPSPGHLKLPYQVRGQLPVGAE
jgi:peptidoglycan/LPS O-acetylase OafA/YrhL